MAELYRLKCDCVVLLLAVIRSCLFYRSLRYRVCRSELQIAIRPPQSCVMIWTDTELFADLDYRNEETYAELFDDQDCTESTGL